MHPQIGESACLGCPCNHIEDVVVDLIVFSMNSVSLHNATDLLKSQLGVIKLSVKFDSIFKTKVLKLFIYVRDA